jgi:hypothetical protein
MLEKFLQAAIITFLLHLIVGLTSNNTIPTRAAKSPGTMSTPIASLLSFLD